jgi:hypothetical protein
MALNKKLLQPGNTVKIVSLKANTAGIGLPNVAPLPGIKLWDVQNKQWTHYKLLNVGDELTIVKLPRIISGVNFCRVATVDNIEGEVFWTELRSNTTLI